MDLLGFVAGKVVVPLYSFYVEKFMPIGIVYGPPDMSPIPDPSSVLSPGASPTPGPGGLCGLGIVVGVLGLLILGLKMMQGFGKKE